VFSGIIAYFAHSFVVFALAVILAAVSMALCSGADSAYLFDLLHGHGRGHEYPRRESISSAWHQVGSAAACAVGGVLGEIDLALPYLVTSVVSAVAFVVALFMGSEHQASPGDAVREPPRREGPGAGRGPILRRAVGGMTSSGSALSAYVGHMKQSVRDVAKNGNLAWVIAYSAVVFVLVRSTEYLYQPYLDARGFSVSEIGFIFAALFLLASFVSHRAHALRAWLGEETLVHALLGALSVSFLLLNQVHGGWAPLAMLAVQAVAMGLFSPLVKTMLNRQITDSSRRATILSVESIARRSAKGICSPIFGYVGATSAIYLCGGIGFVGLVLLVAVSTRVLVTFEPVTRPSAPLHTADDND